jgi:hypothetical protein
MNKMENQNMKHDEHSNMPHYRQLLIMTILSFVAMYTLMYSMADVFSNVIPNVNQFYMAGLMAMPMVLIELTVAGFLHKK